jgi:hypothetical protein
VGKWVPKFSVEFRANIWNIHAANGNSLILELRDPGSESLSYAAVDTDDGSFYMLKVQDPPWFSQVIHAGGKYLLVQVYTDSGNPDEVSFNCYHIASGKCVWRKGSMQYTGSTDRSYLFRRQNGESVTVDQASGDESDVKTSGQFSPLTDPVLEFPAHYKEGEEYFEEAAAFIRTTIGTAPVRAIDYAELGDHIILSFYKVTEKQQLGLDLLVMDVNGETMLYDILGDDLRGIADPPFMFYNGNLIFVKEKRHFFVYALSSQN